MSFDENLVGDSYAPTNPKASLQQYDNYQIYTLICVDYPIASEYFGAVPRAGNISQTDFFGISWDMQTIYNYQFAETLKLKHFLAIQTYSVNPVSINFVTIAQNCTIQPRNKYEYSTYSINRNIRGHSGYITIGYTPQYDFDLYNYEESLAYSNPINYDADPFNFIDYMNYRVYDIGYLTNGISYIIRTHSVGQITYQHFTAQGEPPNYRDLTDRYLGDNRVRPPDNPTLTLSKSGTVKLSYYRRNPYESVPGLVSIDWMDYTIIVKANKPSLFPVINPVFGTLIISGDSALVNEIKQKLVETTLLGNRYGYNYYFHIGNIPAVWTEWVSLYNSLPLPAKPSNSLNFKRKEYTEYYQPIINVLAANNNVWNNSTFAVSDINFDITHPMCEVNDSRSFNWHIKPQSDDYGIGDLIMDSPRTIEIHKALDAGKYAINQLDNTKPRVSTLGHYIDPYFSQTVRR